MTGLAGLETFSGFSVDDLGKAKTFYADVLGLTLTDESDFGFGLVTASQTIFVYDKGDDHAPATYTVLNFQTPDVDGVVDALISRGVEFFATTASRRTRRGWPARWVRPSRGSPTRPAT